MQVNKSCRYVRVVLRSILTGKALFMLHLDLIQVFRFSEMS